MALAAASTSQPRANSGSSATTCSDNRTDSSSSRARDEEFARLQVQLVSVQVFRVGTHGHRARRLVHCPERSAQRRDDGVGDLILDGEDVVQLAVVGFRPQVAVLHRVDQLRGDAHPVARFAHAALEDVVHIQLARDHRRAQLAALVGEGRGARGDANVLHLHQHVEQLFGDAVGEVLVLGVRAHVDERQHRNRFGATGSRGGNLPRSPGPSMQSGDEARRVSRLRAAGTSRPRCRHRPGPPAARRRTRCACQAAPAFAASLRLGRRRLGALDAVRRELPAPRRAPAAMGKPNTTKADHEASWPTPAPRGCGSMTSAACTMAKAVAA
jgi:hypothetical protein